MVSQPSLTPEAIASVPNEAGRFGLYGGRYVPETLMPAIEELETAMKSALADPAFHNELDNALHDFVGRPTALYYAPRLTEQLGGAKI